MAAAEPEEGEIPDDPPARPALPPPPPPKPAPAPAPTPMPLPADARTPLRAAAPAATPPPARAPFMFQPDPLLFVPAPPPPARSTPHPPPPALPPDAQRDPPEELTPAQGEALLAAMNAEIAAGGGALDVKLHGAVPEDDLRAALAAFGPLAAFTYAADKRRASAHFERQEDARRALGALTAVGGVHVDVADATAALWLGNLPARATTADVRALFASSAAAPVPAPARLFVVRAPDGRSLRYAIAEFAAPADAEQAKQALLARPALSVLGRAPVCVESTGGSLRGPALHSALLLLDFLAGPASDDAVRTLCAPFGALLTTRVPPGPPSTARSHAWALFASPMAAISASRALAAPTSPAAARLRVLLWNPVPPLSLAFTASNPHRHPILALLAPGAASSAPSQPFAPHVPLPPPTPAHLAHVPMPPPGGAVPVHAPLPPPQPHPPPGAHFAPAPYPPAQHAPHVPMPPPTGNAFAAPPLAQSPYAAPAYAPPPAPSAYPTPSAYPSAYPAYPTPPAYPAPSPFFPAPPGSAPVQPHAAHLPQPPHHAPAPAPVYPSPPAEAARPPLITAQTAAMAHASIRLQQLHAESVAKRTAPALASPHDKKSKPQN